MINILDYKSIILLAIVILIYIYYYTKINKNKNNYNSPINKIEKFDSSPTYPITRYPISYIGFSPQPYVIESLGLLQLPTLQPSLLRVYTNIGAYHDSTDDEGNYRLIPYRVTNGINFTISDNNTTEHILQNCIKIAILYDAPIFGIQNSSDLYLGYDILSALSLGIKTEPTPTPFLGDELLNQVYIISPPNCLSTPSNYTYKYIGAYKDDSTRRIPIEIPEINIRNFISESEIIENITPLANKYNATVFGLQNGDTLWFGYDLTNATSLDTVECSSLLGCEWINQVYAIIIDEYKDSL